MPSWLGRWVPYYNSVNFFKYIFYYQIFSNSRTALTERRKKGVCFGVRMYLFGSILGRQEPKIPQIFDPQCKLPFENKTLNNALTVRIRHFHIHQKYPSTVNRYDVISGWNKNTHNSRTIQDGRKVNTER